MKILNAMISGFIGGMGILTAIVFVLIALAAAYVGFFIVFY